MFRATLRSLCLLSFLALSALAPNAIAESWFPALDALMAGSGVRGAWIDPGAITRDLTKMGNEIAPTVNSALPQVVQSAGALAGEIVGQVAVGNEGGQLGRAVGAVFSGAGDAVSTTVDALGTSVGAAAAGPTGRIIGGTVACSAASGDNAVEKLAEQSPRIAGGLIGAAVGAAYAGPVGAIVGREIVKSTMCTMDGPAAPSDDPPPDF